jgi:GNAT superfamily N-acetyltransferase
MARKHPTTDSRDQFTVRREFHPGDLEAIVAHHARVYPAEYRLDPGFIAHVEASVSLAAGRDFPREREAIWIVEHAGEHVGSLALTDEGDGEAVVRWFVLDADLRGRGLGRRLMGELLSEAEHLGFSRVALETFSELTAAARIYRDAGFEVVWSETGPRWGRPEINYQRYELELFAQQRRRELARVERA